MKIMPFKHVIFSVGWNVCNSSFEGIFHTKCSTFNDMVNTKSRVGSDFNKMQYAHIFLCKLIPYNHSARHRLP